MKILNSSILIYPEYTDKYRLPRQRPGMHDVMLYRISWLEKNQLRGDA